MPYVSVHVPIEDVWDEVDDDDLLEEVKERGLAMPIDKIEKFNEAYRLHVTGKPELCNALLHEIMLEALNRVV
jgi:hypothetical protein